MRRVASLVVIVVAATAMAGCGGGKRAAPSGLAAEIQENPVYYTQVGMWADEGVRVSGTNFERGVRIPPGSEVRVHGLGRRGTVVFSVPAVGVQEVQLQNTEYTGLDMEGLFNRTFGRQAVDLGEFRGEMRDAIRAGDVQVGMTRDEVIVSRGYPPSHQTPRLDHDEWRYWVHRYGTKLVRFGSDGRVAEIVR